MDESAAKQKHGQTNWQVLPLLTRSFFWTEDQPIGGQRCFPTHSRLLTYHFFLVLDESDELLHHVFSLECAGVDVRQHLQSKENGCTPF